MRVCVCVVYLCVRVQREREREKDLDAFRLGDGSGKCEVLRGSFGEVGSGRDGIGDEKVMTAYGGADDDLGLNVVDESRLSLIERAINVVSLFVVL